MRFLLLQISFLVLLLLACAARGQSPAVLPPSETPAANDSDSGASDSDAVQRLPTPPPGDAEQVETPTEDNATASDQTEGDQPDSPSEPSEAPLDLESETKVWTTVLEEWWEIWEGSLEFGLSGTKGNTETLNFRLGAKVKHILPYMTQTYRITHVDKSNKGEKTALSTLFDARIETPFPDTPWTYFIHGLGEFDQFKAFEMRGSIDSGMGYEFLQEKTNRLVGRIGGSASREFGGESDRYVPELTAGIEWKWKINERVKLAANVDYFPDVTDMNEYRLNSRASWIIVVSPDWGLSLKLSAIDRYDSTPGNAKSNDLDYSLLLLLDF